jgi:hypothetical protein
MHGPRFMHSSHLLHKWVSSICVTNYGLFLPWICKTAQLHGFHSLHYLGHQWFGVGRIQQSTGDFIGQSHIISTKGYHIPILPWTIILVIGMSMILGIIVDFHLSITVKGGSIDSNFNVPVVTYHCWLPSQFNSLRWFDWFQFQCPSCYLTRKEWQDVSQLRCSSQSAWWCNCHTPVHCHQQKMMYILPCGRVQVMMALVLVLLVLRECLCQSDGESMKLSLLQKHALLWS